VVREALGWIPLVTPTSQIVGTQAMMNVKFGRWKTICQPAGDIALGLYGRTPGPIDPTVLQQVEKQTGRQPVTERPADLLSPAMDKYRGECRAKGLPDTDEIAVLYGIFPQQTEALLRPVPAAAAPSAPASLAANPPAASPAPAKGPGQNFSITISGRRYEVGVEMLEG